MTETTWRAVNPSHGLGVKTFDLVGVGMLVGMTLLVVCAFFWWLSGVLLASGVAKKNKRGGQSD